MYLSSFCNSVVAVCWFLLHLFIIIVFVMNKIVDFFCFTDFRFCLVRTFSAHKLVDMYMFSSMVKDYTMMWKIWSTVLCWVFFSSTLTMFIANQFWMNRHCFSVSLINNMGFFFCLSKYFSYIDGLLNYIYIHNVYQSVSSLYVLWIILFWCIQVFIDRDIWWCGFAKIV